MASLYRKAQEIIETCRSDGVSTSIYSPVRNTVPYYQYLAKRSDVYISVTATNPLEPVYISPHQVVAHSPVRFCRREIGSVKEGSWDILDNQRTYPDWCLAKFDDHPLYRAMVQRYEKGVNWSETEWIELVQDELDMRGKGWYGLCKSKREIERRCNEVDRLYESIKNGGYQFGADFHPLNVPERIRHYILVKAYHEITVNIGRDGDIYFNGDGRHRLFLSKLLGLEQIPMLVVVRHKDWQNKRVEFVNSSQTERPAHPDLQNLPCE